MAGQLGPEGLAAVDHMLTLPAICNALPLANAVLL